MTLFDKNNEISELFEKASDGTITVEESRELSDLIVKYPAVCRYYCEYMNLNVCIQRLNSGVDIEELIDNDDLIISEIKSKLVVRKLKRRFVLLAFNAAAVLVILLLLNFTLFSRDKGFAILADSYNAKWSENSKVPKKGKSFSTENHQYSLQEGYVELLYQTNARVLIEAPAEFKITDNNKLFISYGKVFSEVPQEATGFTVSTSSAEIIDLGTKFGVMVDAAGDIELHVIKGVTRLLVDGNTNYGMEVTEGDAKKVIAENGTVYDIKIRDNYFVRDIDSKVNKIWKTQKEINLADFVGGGNGFGSGAVNVGIDPSTAEKAVELLVHHSSSNKFRDVKYNPYIDGVFIPDGSTEQVVNSNNDIFIECPKTGGMCYNNILHAFRKIDVSNFNGKSYSSSILTRSMLIHANAGITFDLNAIRKTIPDERITSFRSIFGIEKNALRPPFINADFWILVDGQVRYRKTNVKDRKMLTVTVELNEYDRFLTLITTDGGDPEGRTFQGLKIETIDSDWCIFADPVLVVE